MKKLYWFIYTVVAVILVVLLFEVGLRVFNPVGSDYIYEAKRYFKIMQPNSVYSYIHTPGTKETFQGVPIRINNEGFRGADFTLPKPDNVYRVLLLGDSVVFSWGVQESESLAAQLQRELGPVQERLGKQIEVLPIGVGSWNSRTQYEFMRERGMSYQPDLIVWIIVNNDLEPKSRGQTLVPIKELKEIPPELQQSEWEKSTAETRGWLAERSHLWALIERYRQSGYMSRLNAYYATEASPQARDAGDALTKLAALAKQSSVALIAFVHGEEASPLGRRYHALYNTLLDQAGVPRHTFSSNIYSNQYTNSLVDPHQNAAGLKIIADQIAGIVSPVILAGQKG